MNETTPPIHIADNGIKLELCRSEQLSRPIFFHDFFSIIFPYRRLLYTISSSCHRHVAFELIILFIIVFLIETYILPAPKPKPPSHKQTVITQKNSTLP